MNNIDTKTELALVVLCECVGMKPTQNNMGTIFTVAQDFADKLVEAEPLTRIHFDNDKFDDAMREAILTIGDHPDVVAKIRQGFQDPPVCQFCGVCAQGDPCEERADYLIGQIE